MPSVPVEFHPLRPDTTGEPVEFVEDLDTYVEHSMCSCSAGDDNPY